jgi:hypothetical protein
MLTRERVEKERPLLAHHLRSKDQVQRLVVIGSVSCWVIADPIAAVDFAFDF